MRLASVQQIVKDNSTSDLVLFGTYNITANNEIFCISLGYQICCKQKFKSVVELDSACWLLTPLCIPKNQHFLSYAYSFVSSRITN